MGIYMTGGFKSVKGRQYTVNIDKAGYSGTPLPMYFARNNITINRRSDNVLDPFSARNGTLTLFGDPRDYIGVFDGVRELEVKIEIICDGEVVFKGFVSPSELSAALNKGEKVKGQVFSIKITDGLNQLKNVPYTHYQADTRTKQPFLRFIANALRKINYDYDDIVVRSEVDLEVPLAFPQKFLNPVLDEDEGKFKEVSCYDVIAACLEPEGCKLHRSGSDFYILQSSKLHSTVTAKRYTFGGNLLNTETLNPIPYTLEKVEDGSGNFKIKKSSKLFKLKYSPDAPDGMVTMQCFSDYNATENRVDLQQKPTSTGRVRHDKIRDSERVFKYELGTALDQASGGFYGNFSDRDVQSETIVGSAPVKPDEQYLKVYLPDTLRVRDSYNTDNIELKITVDFQINLTNRPDKRVFDSEALLIPVDTYIFIKPYAPTTFLDNWLSITDNKSLQMVKLSEQLPSGNRYLYKKECLLFPLSASDKETESSSLIQKSETISLYYRCTSPQGAGKAESYITLQFGLPVDSYMDYDGGKSRYWWSSYSDISHVSITSIEMKVNDGASKTLSKFELDGKITDGDWFEKRDSITSLLGYSGFDGDVGGVNEKIISGYDILEAKLVNEISQRSEDRYHATARINDVDISPLHKVLVSEFPEKNFVLLTSRLDAKSDELEIELAEVFQNYLTVS
ncbi:hypothetical protein V6R21_20125 [Limibacter armeniacum]|uniref:hypothetical protein n=1 Tax=Limibacter armeniacum TaxID=466084 RepID=UPI002FE5492E